MSKLASTLREKRKASGLSVSEVLERLRSVGISISDKTLYNWEKGVRSPDADEFFQLCLIYGVKSFSEFKDETEKAPTSVEVEADERSSIIEGLTSMLYRAGWIREDGDISAEDRRFIRSVAVMLDSYFEEHR